MGYRTYFPIGNVSANGVVPLPRGNGRRGPSALVDPRQPKRLLGHARPQIGRPEQLGVGAVAQQGLDDEEVATPPGLKARTVASGRKAWPVSVVCWA